jgi:hypothetical protein
MSSPPLPGKPGQSYIELVTITWSPQEREAILWGKKAGQKVDKSWTKMGQKYGVPADL